MRKSREVSQEAAENTASETSERPELASNTASETGERSEFSSNPPNPFQQHSYDGLLASHLASKFNEIMGAEYVSVLNSYSQKAFKPQPSYTYSNANSSPYIPLFECTLMLVNWVSTSPLTFMAESKQKKNAQRMVAHFAFQELIRHPETIKEFLTFDYVNMLQKWTNANSLPGPVYEHSAMSINGPYLGSVVLYINDKPHSFVAPYPTPKKMEAKLLSAKEAFDYLNHLIINQQHEN
ncbi:hypothetical protein HK096_002978 [Nowakowskiella sp. JEL0078]|nr:hypothetical protein HK096_002978 [Nowakowskiella sp. JEL0078]